MQELESIFGEGGALARFLPGFRPREAQLDMAERVGACIATAGCLVAEAGTGMGKTLAYLVPAALSGQKLIVSTATRTLQDQLFRKDLPVVRRLANEPLQMALLKGRSNYLCRYRLNNVLGFRAGQGGREAATIEAIRRWARNTATGDIAEASEVPEQSPCWAEATSTADNCLGLACPDHEDCFLVKARARAREADILVINHHLLWADWTLRNDGFGELLPDAGVIIVDEAHQFLESAMQFLGLSITSRQLKDLAEDIAVEKFRSAPEVAALLDEAERLGRLVDDFRLALGAEGRRSWHELAGGGEVVGSGLVALGEQVIRLAGLLKELAIRSKGLESCLKRCREISERLEAFVNSGGEDSVRWCEVRKRGFSLNCTPLEIAGDFSRFRQASPAAWVFASATLTVDGKFDHFRQQLGLDDAEFRAWESPFDYRRNCLLYLPEGLPDPASPSHTAAVIEAALPVLRASQGKALLLFTSYQALNESAAALLNVLDYPLFVQGTQPKTRLLEQFRASGNGVLLGTSTFWEGVDVPGPSLSCVIIDKLPFASPGDPVLGARLESLRRTGRNPFTSHQLPSAIIALKQGVGRLIRVADDRGVLMICDPRLLTRPYGKLFLKSLPDIPRSRSLGDVAQFFSSVDG